MPEPFGSVTVTKILKSESHKLHQEFSVDDLKATITFDADLVTSNTVNGAINGVAISEVTFATDHDTTMDLLVTELEAHADVASVSLTDASTNRQITIVAAVPSAVFVLSGWVVAAGGSQAGTTTVTDTNNIYQGQPCTITTDGKVEPAAAAATPQAVAGISIHDGIGGELVTLSMKAFMLVWCEAGTTNLNAGPVKLHSTPYNTTTGYNSVDDDTVGPTNIFGWALDSGTSAGDLVRVAIYN